MARILYFDGAKHVEIEVTEEFAAEYASLEHGWDIADPSADVVLQAERDEDTALLHSALQRLTDKQRAVLLLYIEEVKSFREIGETLGIHKDTVKEHYHAAIKKLKKFLQ